jgi:hypothetical protein
MKLPVDALPCSADHVGKFLLGHVNRAAGIIRLARSWSTTRQVEQRPSQAAVHMLKDGMLYVLIGMTKTVAKHLEELKAHVGSMFEKREEFAMVEDQQFAIGDRGRIGSSRLPVKQSDFTEDLAGLQNGEYKFAAYRC